jgi:hypothetical protein
MLKLSKQKIFDDLAEIEIHIFFAIRHGCPKYFSTLEIILRWS